VNTLTQSVVSTQYVQVAVTAMVNGAAVDPTGSAVQMAFVPVTSPPSSPDPTSGEWNAATWETDPGPAYWSQILVGPANSGLVLAIGSYVCWVKVLSSPEVPALPGCYFIVT